MDGLHDFDSYINNYHKVYTRIPYLDVLVRITNNNISISFLTKLTIIAI